MGGFRRGRRVARARDGRGRDAGYRAVGRRERRRVGGDPAVLLAAAAHPIQPDALLQHAHANAFLESARLAGLPPALIDLAVVRGGARVLDVACNGSKQNVRQPDE